MCYQWHCVIRYFFRQASLQTCCLFRARGGVIASLPPVAETHLENQRVTQRAAAVVLYYQVLTRPSLSADLLPVQGTKGCYCFFAPVTEMHLVHTLSVPELGYVLALSFQLLPICCPL